MLDTRGEVEDAGGITGNRDRLWRAFPQYSINARDRIADAVALRRRLSVVVSLFIL